LSAGASGRVLVVDDDPSVLETIAAIFTREGYEVATASDSATALASLRAEPFDLVLTDLRIADASGLSLLSEIQRYCPQTMAVVLTGYASLESAIDALREGAYDYLTKPSDVDELRATVARAVERSVLSRTLRSRVEELDAANGELRTFSDRLQNQVADATSELRERQRQLRQKVDELAEANERLEELQRQREEFVSMITHELNQPLTTLNVAAQLLRRPKAPEDSKQRAADTVYQQTQRLARLVQDLGDAARVSSGSFELFAEPQSLATLVGDQVEQQQIRDESRRIHFESTGEPLEVEADGDRIAQVLSNLLTNAAKYAPGGDVWVRLRREDDDAVLTITDRGPGIPEDRLDLIFEPYVRLRSRSSADSPRGSGLGLYISRGIVEAHGGRIWAENAPEGGARFVVRLPLRRAAEARRPRAKRSASGRESGASAGEGSRAETDHEDVA